MARYMPYVQFWKGSYRFRRRVPDHLKTIIGKFEWVAALETKDKADANRLVVPHIARTDQIIRDAERGDYPPLPSEHVEPIAHDWWRWFCQERAKLLLYRADCRIFTYRGSCGLGRVMPCSDLTEQRHDIIGNRLALAGEASVSGVTRNRRRVNQEHPLMRIYILGNDGITLCRKAPATVDDGEIAVASNAELHAAPLSAKRLLALWNRMR